MAMAADPISPARRARSACPTRSALRAGTDRRTHTAPWRAVHPSAAEALPSGSFGGSFPPRLPRSRALLPHLRHERVLCVGLDCRHSSQRRQVANTRTTPSPGLEVLLGEKRRHLLRQCRCDELIDRHALSSSQFASALV